MQEASFTYNVWLRYEAAKSGVGFSQANVTLTRKASTTPPTGNLNPYQLTQNFVLPALEP